MAHLNDKNNRSKIEVGVANAEGVDKRTMSLIVEYSQPLKSQIA